MAARKWSCFPSVTGKCTQQHFEIVNIPTKKASDDNSKTSSVSSYIGPKLRRKRSSDAVLHYIKQDKVYFDLRKHRISRGILQSASETTKRFTSDGCISAGSIVMRVSTDVSRKTLEVNGRSFMPIKEKNSVVSTQRLPTPSPSIISAIIDTEFEAHNQRRMKKWFEKQRATQDSADNFQQQQQRSSYNHIHPNQSQFLDNIDEKLRIKIEHHKDMTEPSSCESTSIDDKQFRRKISKIMKFPYSKISSPTSSTERKSIISFKSSDEIIFDESDYVNKTQARCPVESFSALPLSDEYDSSESSLITKSIVTTDDSGFGLKKEFQSTNKYTNKHRERCESLLKEAEERIRFENKPKKFHQESPYPFQQEKRTYYVPPPSMVSAPTTYCVPNAPINSLIKNSVELFSEMLDNEKESPSSYDTARDSKTCKTQVDKESNDSLHIPVGANKFTLDGFAKGIGALNIEELCPNVNDSDEVYQMKINLLRRRLMDWKAKTCKSEENTTEKVTKKKRTESKRSLKTTRTREDRKKIKEVQSKASTRSGNDVDAEEVMEGRREKRGVLKRVIPNWLRIFGSRKTTEGCPNKPKDLRKGQNLDRKSAPTADKTILKRQKSKCC